ncbi:MAG: hypothetical protein E3J72_13155 [Planctomycetota bacterium]|nr:MAG: hypothetical protein E3J72_13155 [Planctomycetota bacterium]
MNCEEIKSRIQEFLDGELGNEEAEQVSRHLESCDRCRSEADAMRQVINAVAGLPRASAPGDFLESVLVRRRKESGEKPADNIVSIQRRPFTSRIVGLAATVIVAIILVLVLVRVSKDEERVAVGERTPATDISEIPENASTIKIAEKPGVMTRDPEAAKDIATGKAGEGFFKKKAASELLALKKRDAKAPEKITQYALKDSLRKKTKPSAKATPKHAEDLGKDAELEKESGDYARRAPAKKQTAVGSGAGRSAEGMRPHEGRGYVDGRERTKKAWSGEKDYGSDKGKREDRKELADGTERRLAEKKEETAKPGDADAPVTEQAKKEKEYARLDREPPRQREPDEAEKNLRRSRKAGEKAKSRGRPSAEPEAPPEPDSGVGQKSEEQSQTRDRMARKEREREKRDAGRLKDDIDKLAKKEKSEASPPERGQSARPRPARRSLARAKTGRDRAKAKKQDGQFAGADEADDRELIEGENRLVFRGDEVEKARSLLKKLEKDFPNLVMVTEKKKLDEVKEEKKLAGPGGGAGRQRGRTFGEEAPEEAEEEEAGGAEEKADAEEEEPAGETLVLEVDSASFARLVARLESVRDAEKANRGAPGGSIPKSARKKAAGKPARPTSGKAKAEAEEKVLVIVIRARPEAAAEADKKAGKAERAKQKTPTKSK